MMNAMLSASNPVTMMYGPNELADFGDEYAGYFGDNDLGFSLRKLASKAGGLAKKAVKTGIKVTTAPVVYSAKGLKYVGQKAAGLALKPIRSRINVLVNRRANKLAWDKRKSKTPTAAERGEARNWAKNELRKKGPHGKLAALLAGPTPVELLGTSVGAGGLGLEPATMTLIAASIPAFIALVNSVINRAGASGEAPADAAQALVDTAQQMQNIVNPASTPVTTPQEVQQANAAVPDEMAPEAVNGVAGYLGVPPDNTSAIVLGLLGVAALGAGIYGATRR